MKGDSTDLNWLGSTLNRLERYGEALPYLQKAVNEQDDWSNNHWLANTLYKLGRYEEAFPHFRQAFMLRGNDVDHDWVETCQQRIAETKASYPEIISDLIKSHPESAQEIISAYLRSHTETSARPLDFISPIHVSFWGTLALSIGVGVGSALVGIGSVFLSRFILSLLPSGIWMTGRIISAIGISLFSPLISGFISGHFLESMGKRAGGFSAIAALLISFGISHTTGTSYEPFGLQLPQSILGILLFFLFFIGVGVLGGYLGMRRKG